MIRADETGRILPGNRVMEQNVNYGGNNLNIRNEFQQNFQNTNFFSFVTDEQFRDIGIYMLRQRVNPFEVRSVANGAVPANPQNGAVIACHAFGRHCFVTVEYGGRQVYRPVSSSLFINYFNNDIRYQAINNAAYVKLFVCFSGSRPGSTSIAQKFATALNKTVYGTRGVTWPCKADQQYLMFK